MQKQQHAGKKGKNKQLSLSFLINGVPHGVGAEEVAIYFAQFGSMPACKQSAGGIVATFADESSIQAMLRDEPHSIDGLTRMVLHRLPPQSQKEDPQERQQQENRDGVKIYVGRLGSHVTGKNIKDYFSIFGTVENVTIPEPFRGVCTVEFADSSSANLALGCPAHMIKGSSATVRKHKAVSLKSKVTFPTRDSHFAFAAEHHLFPHSTGKNESKPFSCEQRGTVNTSLAWRLVQQGNMFDADAESAAPDPEVLRKMAMRGNPNARNR